MARTQQLCTIKSLIEHCPKQYTLELLILLAFVDILMVTTHLQRRWYMNCYATLPQITFSREAE